MSASDLESLTITNLRGYVQSFSLAFERHRKLCIVYGENGTGKSTLCDALDLLGTDNVGSLDGRGLGRTERFLAPLGQNAAGTIELKAGGPTLYTATIQAGRVTRANNAPRPRVRVLRRPQVLNIVNASAADRYKAIADLVDVSGVEASEQSLATLVKDTQRDADTCAARVVGAKQIFEDLFNVAAAAGDPIAWARKEVQADLAALRAAREGLRALKAAYETMTRRVQAYEAGLDAASRARAETDTAAVELSALEVRAEGTDAETVALLEAASKLLASHGEGKVCPLCQATTHADGLKARIGARLAEMGAVQVAMARDARAKRVLQATEQALAKEQQRYVSERAAFCSANLQHASYASLPMPIQDPPEDVAQLSSWLDETNSAFEVVASRHAEFVTRADNLDRLRAALSTYDEDYQLADRAAKLVEAAKEAHDLVRGTRHDFVNGMLQQISEEVGRLYELVHPGEGVGKISLALDANRKSSLDLRTSFLASTSVPPQAYLSDSHLDTLGVCVFLALAKMRDASDTILVLDDVLASVDEPHVDRLVEVIYEQAQGFRHVLVTTHYRPWREKLRWGWLKNGQCQLVELGRWSPNAGPSLVRSTAEIERLRKLLNDEDFDAQAVCGKAGVVLEALLDFLTELYQCRLPRKSRNDWTLGDLLPAFGRKLRAALKAEHQDPADTKTYTSHPLGPVIEELQRVAQTRNLQGAHFNKLSFELLDSDAKYFATKVLELADLVVHPEHGWPRSDKSGRYWATANEALRLHPLREPT
jgi:ABC-type transport system involved in cytochrome c biogenesis ATPase subunit